MGLNISRIVEIQIKNKTRNITLRNPRIHFFSGRVFSAPQSSLSPGSSRTFRFTNNSGFWGCNGVLAYEADSFTLAIYFSNPIDYNRFSLEMGLELSLDRVHRMELEAAYDRLVRSSRDFSRNAVFPCVFLKKSKEEIQLSAGLVTVTATMAGERDAVITVEVEERGNSPASRPLVQPDTSRRSGNLRDLQENLLESPGTARMAENPAGTPRKP